jgi:hypothetical protein
MGEKLLLTKLIAIQWVLKALSLEISYPGMKIISPLYNAEVKNE